MQKKSSRFVVGMILCLAVGLAVGCAGTPKKPSGAFAHAEKGVASQAVNDTGPLPQHPEMPGEQIPITDLEGAKNAGLCQRIHFDYDKADIKSEWVDCLNKIAAFLVAKPEFMLVIEGHCDERGTNEYNLSLGERRAKAAADYLISKGLNAGRIVTRSWGEERPLVVGHDDKAWAQNRRAEFYGVKK